MGRRKIEIQPITHERNRSVTFLKRKNGLFKKAYELGVLCSVDVAVIIFNPAGTANKLFEYCSGDLDSIVRRRAEFQGDRDFKTAIDYTGEGRGHAGKSFGGNGADSDEDEDDSDHAPISNQKPAPPSSKQKLAGTRSRPMRSAGRNGLQDEKQDVDELEDDSNQSYSRKRSPPSRLSPSEEDGSKRMHGRSRGDVAPPPPPYNSRDGGRNATRDPRDENPSDHWPPSPPILNRQLGGGDGGYPSAHDILLGGGASAFASLGLPLALNQLVSQLSPQQLASLSPHLNLTAQQQDLLALQAAKQQEQQLHIRQREQLATLQNSLRGNPNRLATLNLNLSGLTGLGGLGSLGGLGAGGLANLGGLGGLAGLGGGGGGGGVAGGPGAGLRDLGGLGLNNSLTGLPIRKMGLGGGSGLPSFPASLSSITSSGTGPQGSLPGVHGLAPSSGHTPLPYPHSSLGSNPNNNNNSGSGSNLNEQSQPNNGSEEGSWLDFLSFPTGRVDPSSLTGLSALGGLGLGGLMDRESATRTSTNLNGSGDHGGSTSSLFDYAFGGGPAPGGNNNNPNNNSNHSAYGSGAASGGGYGLGLGLGLPDRERNSRSRGEGMDLDKESTTTSGLRDELAEIRERERDMVDPVTGDREDEGHARKRPRWD